MTLLPLLLAIQNRSPFVTAPNAQEPLVALAFLREAYTGLAGSLDPSFDLRGETKIEMAQTFNGPTRQYVFFCGRVDVDVTTGRIVAYGGGPHGQRGRDISGQVTPRAVSDRAARAIAQRLYNAAGFPGEIEAYRIDDPGGSTDEDVMFWYSPVVNGIPCEGPGAGQMAIDRLTGLLHFFVGSNVRPAPPASLVPALSLDAARAMGLRAGIDRQGEALSETTGGAFRLVVWAPDPDHAPETRSKMLAKGVRLPDYEETAAVGAARKAGRGILAYSASLEGGNPADPLIVVVDAQTGAMLSFGRPNSARFGPASNGGLGGSGVPPRPPLLPATATRPWRVAVGDSSLVGPVAATLTLVAGAAPTIGEKVDLTDGKAAFPARYDPATGLLAIGGRAYRPGPALADLLRRRAAR